MPMRSATVTTAVTEIADYNPQRVAFALQNNGTVRVFVSHDAVNILQQGWPVDPGVMLSFSVADGDQPWLQFFAQTASGSAELRIYEGFSR
jgi:hypothetical protein